MWFGGSTLTAATLPTNGAVNLPVSQNLALSESHTSRPHFSSRRVRDSHGMDQYQVQDAGLNAAPLFPGVPGIVNAMSNPVDSGLPRVGISGYASLGGSNSYPSGRITNTYELFSNATKLRRSDGAATR